MAMHIDPTAAQFGAFMKLGADYPIQMLNIIRLKAKTTVDGEGEMTGEEAYRRYAKESAKIFKRVGGEIVWTGAPEATVIGPEEDRWDICFIAQYPNSAAFVEMVKDPEYQAIVKYRQAAVADSRLIRIKPGAGQSVFG